MVIVLFLKRTSGYKRQRAKLGKGRPGFLTDSISAMGPVSLLLRL